MVHVVEQVDERRKQFTSAYSITFNLNEQTDKEEIINLN